MTWALSSALTKPSNVATHSLYTGIRLDGGDNSHFGIWARSHVGVASAARGGRGQQLQHGRKHKPPSRLHRNFRLLNPIVFISILVPRGSLVYVAAAKTWSNLQCESRAQWRGNPRFAGLHAYPWLKVKVDCISICCTARIRAAITSRREQPSRMEHSCSE